MSVNTLDYYNNNADVFAKGTIDVEMHTLQDKFLSYLDKGSFVLDLGCGAGRDSAYFLSKGMRVEAVDGSEKLVEIATVNTSLPVRHLLFENLDYKDVFDGIWACASLLHVKKDDIKEILNKCFMALKVNGIFYLSFKQGNFEGERNGRYFSDYTLDEIESILSSFDNNIVLDGFITKDARPDRTESWVNVIVKKVRG